MQSLGSGSGYGSVRSERFGLHPGPGSEKYADTRIRIQGVKYQPKTAKKLF